MREIQKETNKETETKKETKKLQEVFAFIDKLKAENKIKLSENDFQKEVILFFSISDFRVVGTKTKLLTVLSLIEIKEIGWNKREIWIK